MYVLFIGNSFTVRNDLPGLLGHMAAERGHQLRHDLIAAGGASLRAHWNKGAALEAIRAARYDFVVLQEQSTLPIKNPGRFQENVRLFIDPIAQSGARPALYLTWARKTAPASQRVLTDAYTEIARETGAVLVPVGIAWEAYLGRHGSPPLHDKDQSHPSPAGTYLAASVFFATLFRESPVGLGCSVAGVTASEARRLQQTAWRAIGSPRRTQ